MQDTKLFETILGIQAPWTIPRVALDTSGERVDLWGRAQGDLARHLLDAIDDLERVAHHAVGEVNAQGLLEGVQLIEKKLRQTLSVAGLEISDAAAMLQRL